MTASWSPEFKSLAKTVFDLTKSGEYIGHRRQSETPVDGSEVCIFAGAEDEGGTPAKLKLEDGLKVNFTRIAHLNLITATEARFHYLSAGGEVYAHYMADGEGIAFKLSEDMLQAVLNEIS